MKLQNIDYTNINKEIIKRIKPEDRVDYYNCYSKSEKIVIIKKLSLSLKERGYTLSEIAQIVNSLGYRTHVQNKEFTVHTIFRIITRY